jgi:serine phosphatase RsbU (regulator of sigma subunit)/anti-sigma regulatory factor (Ser/Thr protein kinase)/tetratricopeptide (TPR) repeat protein/transposase
MFRKVIKEECKVPADIKYLGEMRNFVTHVGRKYGVPERILNAFKLAIDEGGTNIIRHAYRDWDGFVTLRMIIRNKDVSVSLIDQGHTFDLRQVRDPDLQRYVDIGKKGGLGIFIIRRVVDGVDYRKTVEGNELKLVKNLPHFPRRRIRLPGMGLSLKLRYAVYAGILWSLLAVAVWFVTNVQQRSRILRSDLALGGSLARTLAHQCVDPLVRDETIEMARIAAEFQRDHSPQVLEALVVDSAGVVQGSVVPERILEPYRPGAVEARLSAGVSRIRTDDGKRAFEIEEPIVQPLVGTRVGTVHLLLDKAVTDRKTASALWAGLRMLGIIWALGAAGIFALVFLITNPLRRLVRWINAAGAGDIQDEVEFDQSDEIGEIAHAFNEITEKFRKSQENLAEQERLQKEMQVAQEIQHTLLPSSFPQIEGYEIASYYEAAREVGGDYFDFVEVDKDTLGIVVADVSGKGVPGSLIMTMIRTALRTEARGNKNAADVLARVNDFVINDMKRGMFVTVFYVILDSHNRTINYASAGHNPMILYRAQSNKSYYLNPRGFPIGLNLPDRSLFRKSIESDTIHLKEGDVLIAYTDGITEAMNAQREKFGEERFLSVIRRCGLMMVDPLVDRIKEDIKTFTGGEAQSDDITLVAIKEKMRAEDVLFNLRSKLIRMVTEEGLSARDASKKAGVSTSTYYKYKKRWDRMGDAGLREMPRSDVEENHIAIEDKVKIHDIIKNQPDLGAKRLAEELNTEKYGFTVIDEKRLYDELVRTRLNTKERRQVFSERGGKGKRTKPPGTPFLTLDGQIIMDTGRRRERPPALRPRRLDDQAPTISIRASQIKSEPEEPAANELPVVIEPDVSESAAPAAAEAQAPRPASESGETAPPAGPAPAEAENVSGEASDGLLGGLFDWLDENPAPGSGPNERPQPAAEIPERPASPVPAAAERDEAENRIAESVGGELFAAAFAGEPDDAVETFDSGLFERIDGSPFEGDTTLSAPGSRDESRIAAMLREMNSRRHMDSGKWFYKQGLYAKAIEEFRRILDEKPDSWEAYQSLGDAWYRLGQLEKATEAYERVRLLNPENVNVLENLGVIFANRGEYKRAVWQWGEILKRNPQRSDIMERIKRMQKLIRSQTV